MEILHAWQPVTSIKGRNLADLGFFEIIPHPDYLKIRFNDVNNDIFEVIYDQSATVEYNVWSFRFSTEYGRFDLNNNRTQVDYSGIIDKDSLYFFKVSNSEYIKWFDRNPLINSQTNPKLEHHMYMNGNYVFEVLSEYEPKILKVT